MNVVREIERMNAKDLARGKLYASWHDDYKDSAWIFIGNLDYKLSEGDVLCFMSQWGEVGALGLLIKYGFVVVVIVVIIIGVIVIIIISTITIRMITITRVME